MTYINMAAADKHNRNTQINSDLGSTAYLMIYTGSYPLSPDITTAGTLLCALPCSNPFGTVSYFVQNASIGNSAGTGGSGSGVVTVSGGTYTTQAQLNVTVSGGAITAITSVATPGVYSVLPSLNNVAVTGLSLSGATVNLACSSILTANAITQTNAGNSGTAGFARLATSNASGGAGIVDLDVGTTGSFSVQINTTSISSGGPISVTSATIAEA